MKGSSASLRLAAVTPGSLLERRTWLRTVEADQFHAFLEALREECELASVDALPEGIGELSTGRGIASYAVSRKARFAAIRWLDTQGLCVCLLESFFVCPASGPARSGLLQRLLAGANPPPPEPRFLETWRRAAWGKVQNDSPAHPSFTELAALLASGGQAPVANAGLVAQVQALTEELEFARLIISEQAEELRTARENLSVSRAHVPALRDLLLTDEDLAGPLGEQSGLEELPAWAAENSERIVVLPRALRGARKSIYQDPALIMASLELLAGPYRALRLGQLSQEEFDAALAATGAQVSGSAARVVAGMHGQDYFVTWAGRRRFLDQHVAKGGGRDERYCLRIYFFWDEESSRCVVGSLPAHLPNSLA